MVIDLSDHFNLIERILVLDLNDVGLILKIVTLEVILQPLIDTAPQGGLNIDLQVQGEMVVTVLSSALHDKIIEMKGKTCPGLFLDQVFLPRGIKCLLLNMTEEAPDHLNM